VRVLYDYHLVFGAFGVLLGLAGYGLYFRSIFRGETKPHLFTWVTYALIDAIVFVAQALHGAGAGSWALLLCALANAVIAVLALRRGEKHIATVDWISFAAALLCIALWILTSNALVAVVLASAVNVFGIVPTFRKSYTRPDQESVSIWTMDMFMFGASLIALDVFSLTTALFPVVIVLQNSVLVGMVLIRRRQLGRVSQI
jgi:hypothetical protein